MFYFAIIRREIKLAIRNNLIHTLVLFSSMLSILMFSADIINNVNFLPIILWICTTFTSQSSVRHIFENDYQNGTLEQLLMQNKSLELMISIKIFFNWMCLCLPTTIISVIIIFITFNNIKYSVYIGILLSITSLVSEFVCSVGHALIIGKNGGTAIAQIISLPIILPVLIYFNTLSNTTNYYEIKNDLILFTQLILSLIPISTFFTSIAVKLTIENH